jgi:hypothetical protein
MEEWLIPWHERSRSGPIHDNFLWRSDNLYVMDNHRLALWCWWQHLDRESIGWDFVHIDQHEDALWQIEQPWKEYYEPSHKSNLDSFRKAKYPGTGDLMTNLYRWDVITSALLSMDGNKINKWIFATPTDEKNPLRVQGKQSIPPCELPALLDSMAKSDSRNPPIIIDIDLDYFTHFDSDGMIGGIPSTQYLQEINRALIQGLVNKRFGIITVALSPETTGSWELAEKLCWELLKDIPGIGGLRAGAPKYS